MNEEQITKEVKMELKKNLHQMANDIIREANNHPKSTLSERESLDIIKHLIKRLDLQQLNSIKKQNFTNTLLIILSIIMAIGSVFTILTYFG